MLDVLVANAIVIKMYAIGLPFWDTTRYYVIADQ